MVIAERVRTQTLRDLVLDGELEGWTAGIPAGTPDEQIVPYLEVVRETGCPYCGAHASPLIYHREVSAIQRWLTGHTHELKVIGTCDLRRCGGAYVLNR